MPKKSLTKYILKFPLIKDVFTIVYDVYYREKKKRQEMTLDAMDTLLPKFGINLPPNKKKELFEASDLDGNKDIEFREFLITVGSAVIEQKSSGVAVSHNVYAQILPGFEIVLKCFIF
eukprot:UN24852